MVIRLGFNGVARFILLSTHLGLPDVVKSFMAGDASSGPLPSDSKGQNPKWYFIVRTIGARETCARFWG
jgi:hypothetical protein